MRLIDEQYLRTPDYGYRRMTANLRRSGESVNPKRISRLMGVMGLVSVLPKPNLSQPNKMHKKYPYLLKGLKIDRVNQVWSTDITYIPMRQGFLYLVVVMDWYSRYVLAWELSNSLDPQFCITALERALSQASPSIFNTDQGSQFTCKDFIEQLTKREIKVSMDGKGRALDNVFIERLWWSLKYERVYLNNYASVPDAALDIGRYLQYYNTERVHQALGYATPEELYRYQYKPQGYGGIEKK